MYITSLPDHTAPGFNEALHFGRFQQQNMVFNALSRRSNCDNHVGCLSFKTVLRGEEWYGIDRRRVAVRPGQFLLLNDDQRYACKIDSEEPVSCLSVFFKKTFATAVFRETLQSEESLMDDPFSPDGHTPTFFQTLNPVTPVLQRQLHALITDLESTGYEAAKTDEHLVFLLHQLLRNQGAAVREMKQVHALKPAVRKEIYQRLCMARDLLHSCYMDQPDLQMISREVCLSVPQLVRQFKAVFRVTPYQYLIRIRLYHAAILLRQTNKPVLDITWMCGFENMSAFCRAFKAVHGLSPLHFRKQSIS
ncbi:helix-turn-helix transcriptional regulator [Chitinophaga nivalis]|uniref:AraC family transcriptional regulator n=1 Tax=Chitinophaga nivalis TaxID=2991709 RepID=A0ABT3IKG4_9BACT|nr:AraC family transcriptional regulator [Chitinophaga nivalis]MCW3465866.1 AraC family transcriptional regulator [Chitinophaga nivalis]MCW3484443.1 AraC family transcriptional regulator [Chitinophaga nivalis]